MESKAAEISASSHSHIPNYYVYLSVFGDSLDKSNAFIDSLCTSLTDAGVRTFRGEEFIDLKLLLKSIQESKISIAIFSQNYGSSTHRLRELTQMLECRETMGQIIFPIYYHVDPADYQLQMNDSDAITLMKWDMALIDVASLACCVVKDIEAEGRVVRKVVETVLLEFKNDNLAGIDHHANEMQRLLDIGTNGVRIVGIHGMGGIGKTTIAKSVYDKLFCSFFNEFFEGYTFLADVRERAQQPNGLVDIQTQLLSDTLNFKPKIHDVHQGINMIRDKIFQKRVLVVLDDMDRISQFESLVGDRDHFGPGSRIIVTTRNKHVLDVIGVDATYEPPFMTHVQSLHLFSMHAFRSGSPRKDYDTISRKVVSTAGGLPLALEATGSFLSDKELVVWEDTLKKLEKIPHSQVEKKLRLSYEALSYEQQQIFLDIACLFIGMDIETVFYMLDDPSIFRVLCQNSLVKVGDANEIRMHDQLRALGRKIDYEEGKIPGKRSRLWNHEESFDILDGQRGIEMVEALSLHFELGREKKPCFTSMEFLKLEHLRYLQVDGADLVGDFKHLLPCLRWLRWHGCSPHFKPTNFHLENLVILDLSNSGVTEDWEGWNQIKITNKLKVLRLANCALRRTPDLSSYATLEILILRGCKNLVEIGQSIGNLKNLKVLDVSYAGIRKLPDEVWMLENVEVMDFTCCSYLKDDIPTNLGSLLSLRFLSFYDTKIQSLPTSILNLTCLQTLNLGGCTELQSQPELPSSLRILGVAYIPNLTCLVNLQELNFYGCHKDGEIPADIGKLSKLEKLTLDSTNFRTLPKDIDTLSELKVLDVRFCDGLQNILWLPSSLVDLSLAHCQSLEYLQNFSNLKILQKLSLNSCGQLTQVFGLGTLESLTTLEVYACRMLANLNFYKPMSWSNWSMSYLSNFQILAISDCPELKKIRLKKLESLKYLDLHDCKNLNEIEGLNALPSLEVLNVSGCISLKAIPKLPNTHILWGEDQIPYHVDSIERYRTTLRERRLSSRVAVISGYQSKVTREAFRNQWNLAEFVKFDSIAEIIA